MTDNSGNWTGYRIVYASEPFTAYQCKDLKKVRVTNVRYFFDCAYYAHVPYIVGSGSNLLEFRGFPCFSSFYTVRLLFSYICSSVFTREHKKVCRD